LLAVLSPPDAGPQPQVSSAATLGLCDGTHGVRDEKYPLPLPQIRHGIDPQCAYDQCDSLRGRYSTLHPGRLHDERNERSHSL